MRTRPAPNFRYWNAASQTAPRPALDAIHLEKIKRLVAWAYERSPLHRRLYRKAGVKPSDIKSWDDFYYRLPFTDKDDYLADQEKSPAHLAALAVPEGLLQQYFHTTGTTGTFLNEVFTHYEMQKGGSQLCYGYWDNRVRPGDTVYFCFNWGLWIGLWSLYWGARELNLRIISGGGLSTEERIDQIIKHKPKIVIATPTYLLYLAQQAQEKGASLKEARVKILGGGGETGLSVPIIRRRLFAQWGVRQIIDSYGVGETLFVAQSCRRWAGGVHVIEDVCHAYSVDPRSGEPLRQPGAIGENIITSYTHLSQPFIKYRTHDLVRMDREPAHGCGWTWAHLPGTVLGRTDFMVTIRGVNVYPTAVENLIGSVRALSHHYELHIERVDGLDRMLVKVEAAQPNAPRTQLATALADVLRANLGVRLNTEVVEAGSLPRYELKSRHIFDHRSRQERAQAPSGRPKEKGPR